MARSRDDRPSTVALLVTIVAVLLVFGALAVVFAPELTADGPTPSGIDSNGSNVTDDDRERNDESELATGTSDSPDDSGSGDDAPPADNDRDDGDLEIVDRALEDAGITDDDSDEREDGPPTDDRPSDAGPPDNVGPPDDVGPPDAAGPFDD